MSKGTSLESETSASSSKYDPIKALYSEKPKLPVKKTPMFQNLVQYEAALKYNTQQCSTIIPVGFNKLVQQREEEKVRKKKEQERLVEEKNKQRFAQYEVTPRREKHVRNVLTRIGGMTGPLSALNCVDQRLRIRVLTRNANGIRAALYATLVAFDKQWNLALTDVLEVWTKKSPRKRKIPPALDKDPSTKRHLGAGAGSDGDPAGGRPLGMHEASAASDVGSMSYSSMWSGSVVTMMTSCPIFI